MTCRSSCPPVVGVADWTFSSCGPQGIATGYLEESIQEINQHILRHAMQMHVRSVVLVARWEAYCHNATFETSLTATVTLLARSGIRVLIMRQVPRHVLDVPQLLAKAVIAGRNVRNIGIPFSEHRKRNRMIDAIFDRLAERCNVTILDPAPYFVDENGLCRAEFDGQSMYFDDDHLSVAGAMRLKPMFEEALREQFKKSLAERVGPVKGR